MAIGIDFGTTNSVVAHWHGGKAEPLAIDQPPMEWGGLGFDRVLPTVIARSSAEALLFGWEAKQIPGNLAAVKRLLRTEERAEVNGEEYAIEEVVTLLFGQLRRAAAGQGVAFDRAVVTVPANSRGLARYRTKLCAGMAGVQVQALINEPTAAAMAYSMRSSHEENLLVVDWGGGTLDVTVLRNVDGIFMEQASKGVGQSGGLDFDAALARVLEPTIDGIANWSPGARAGFRLDLERAKVVLSKAEEASVPIPGGEYRHVDRRYFEEAIQERLKDVREPIATCLADLGYRPNDIDAVVLVGGTCNIPAVRNVVAEVMEQSPVSGIDPMTCVAEGAAIAAAILDGELASHDFFVSTEHALGTIALGVSRELEFSPLIPRNHKLPARATDSYLPATDMQDSVEIQVVEGDPAKPLDDIENVVMKSWTVPIADPQPVGLGRIDLTYSYDTDGILHVEAQDHNGTVLLDDDVSHGVGLGRRDLVEISGRASEALEAGRLPSGSEPASELTPEARKVVSRARQKVMPFVDDDDRTRLMSLVERCESGEKEAVGELEAALSPFSYLL